MEPLARTLVIAGGLLLALGLILHLAPSVPWLGRLPGDLRIERPGLRVHVPLTTCLVLSLVLSLALWAFSKLR